MAKRFTEAEKQAALADLKNDMTVEQAAGKHKCSTASVMQWKKTFSSSRKATGKRTRSKAAAVSGIQSANSERMMELEDETKYLKDENQSLRGLMLDGYIAREQQPKLRQIAQTLREAGRNQLQRIMEIILVDEAEKSIGSESPQRPESSGERKASNGLPRHPSGAIKLRRKGEQVA